MKISTGDIFDAYVAPKFILQWAIHKGLEIPEELLKLHYQNQVSIIQNLDSTQILETESFTEEEPIRTVDRNMLSVPVISSNNTNNWKEDVQMAFNDYYRKYDVAPTAEQLCKYITSKKKTDETYAQYIIKIILNADLIIDKNGINKSRKWNTFGKEITAATKKLPEMV